MKKKSVFYLERPLRRYCFYQAATRMGAGLLVSVLWHRFANPNGLDINGYAFFFMAVFFLLLAWITYLRLDGIRAPRLKMDFLKKIKKKVVRSSYPDMSDYTDEEIIPFDELEEDEKARVLLQANLLCAVLFLVLSFL